MPYSYIRFEADASGIALVTVNRPEKRNALSKDIVRELREAFEQVEREPEIKAAILTGAGEKAFVAGADIGELAALSPVKAQRFARQGQAVSRLIETLSKPVVAAVNGYALGAAWNWPCLARCGSPRITPSSACPRQSWA